jgi:4-hydroxy 2-oxovalerate aldolase
MVSGAHSLPQKEVMEWVSKGFYSYNSIIRALTNQSKGIKDNVELEKLDFSERQHFTKALIIGGGPSAVEHAEAIHKFLEKEKDLIIIHASSKNALGFQRHKHNQLFCLVGNEGHRLEQVFDKMDAINGICVLPPFPRKMGTYIPEKMKDQAYELPKVDFSTKFTDSHTAIALQTALDLGINEDFIAGYDGYTGEAMGNKEHTLFIENEYLFKAFNEKSKMLKAITETGYDGLEATSVYAFSL